MLLVLLILLSKYDGNPLSEWHSSLTPSTIIAVVTQLVQMALLFPIASSLSQLQWLWYRTKKPLKDISYFKDASTGLTSSLILLYRHHASLSVWLGVICMILQALFGAFAQQALSLPIRQISVSENGTISRSITYDTPLGSEQIGGVTSPEVVSGMKLAILTGLLRDGVNASEVQGNSVTGNCTFGVFVSMGICASVEDVTSTIVADCEDTEHSSGISDDICSYTVPALRNTHPFSNVRTRAGEDSHSVLYMGAGMIHVKTDLVESSKTPINDTLIEFYIIYVPDLTTLAQNGGKTNYTGKLAALKATLSLCVHIYNSSMQSGITNTTLQARETHLPWRHGTAANDNKKYGYAVFVPKTSETLFMNPMSLNGLSVWLITSTFNGTVTMMPPPAQSPNPHHLNTISNNSAVIFSTLASKQVATHLYGNEGGIKVPDGVNALLKVLENVAMSMSNALRITSTVSTIQIGTSYTMEIYFQVSWLWLIVPILSIPITLTFLALTILRSWQNNNPAWKSCRLAALQALSPRIKARLGGGMAENSELEEVVRREGVEVRLRRVEGARWELGDE
ncbi:MAG: hypothetical protein M1836_006551 [Candelina mexicana]|nr:MAG: hypothetical protein M1836_006551 [Candelina mexicana]